MYSLFLIISGQTKAQMQYEHGFIGEIFEFKSGMD